jgi:hypothetical protein
MQFDIGRAFPYPVLRHGVDDYLDGEFQASVEFQQADSASDITLNIAFGLSVDEIREAIEARDASFVAVVSCRDTYFRRAIQTHGDVLQDKFPAGGLRGRVDVYPYVIVDKIIPQFSSKLINPEFGGGPFRFEVGALLAVEQPKAVYLDRDLFRPISSVFELAKNENLSPGEWRVDLSGDLVRIAVHPSTKEKIDVFRAVKIRDVARLQASINEFLNGPDTPTVAPS